MEHALWCPAHVTDTERQQGRRPGRCTCKAGTPRCPKTIEMFPDEAELPAEEGEGRDER